MKPIGAPAFFYKMPTYNGRNSFAVTFAVNFKTVVFHHNFLNIKLSCAYKLKSCTLKIFENTGHP